LASRRGTSQCSRDVGYPLRSPDSPRRLSARLPPNFHRPAGPDRFRAPVPARRVIALATKQNVRTRPCWRRTGLSSSPKNSRQLVSGLTSDVNRARGVRNTAPATSQRRPLHAALMLIIEAGNVPSGEQCAVRARAPEHDQRMPSHACQIWLSRHRCGQVDRSWGRQQAVVVVQPGSVETGVLAGVSPHPCWRATTSRGDLPPPQAQGRGARDFQLPIWATNPLLRCGIPPSPSPHRCRETPKYAVSRSLRAQRAIVTAHSTERGSALHLASPPRHASIAGTVPSSSPAILLATGAVGQPRRRTIWSQSCAVAATS